MPGAPRPARMDQSPMSYATRQPPSGDAPDKACDRRCTEQVFSSLGSYCLNCMLGAGQGAMAGWSLVKYRTITLASIASMVPLGIRDDTGLHLLMGLRGPVGRR
jgi:hypothetical protein